MVPEMELSLSLKIGIYVSKVHSYDAKVHSYVAKVGVYRAQIGYSPTDFYIR